MHRADLGVRGEVNTVERAVVLLGFEAVRSAVLAISVFQTFQRRTARPKRHISAARNSGSIPSPSRAARNCSRQQMVDDLGQGRRIDPSEAFVCGLLHDMGKVALDAVLPKSFSRVVEAADLLRGNIADVERTSSAWITWSSANGWPSDGSCRRRSRLHLAARPDCRRRCRRRCNSRGWST